MQLHLMTRSSECSVVLPDQVTLLSCDEALNVL